MIELKDRFTLSKNREYYSDFLINFDMNPVTGYLARVTNEESVKQSIRNLIMTTKTERFYRSDVGSKIRSQLFAPIDVTTEELLRNTIREAIENNEPRAKIIGVDVQGREDWNAYLINIFFEVLNMSNQEISMSLILKRVR